MRRRTDSGVVVVLSMGVVVVIGALGSTALMRSLHEQRLGSRSAARQQAFFLAEAGIDQALINLETDDLADDVTTDALLTGSFQLDHPPVILGPLQRRVRSHGYAQGEARHIEAVLQLTPESLFQFALFGAQRVNISGNAQTDSYDSRQEAYNQDAHGHNGDVGTNATASGAITVGGSIFVDGQLAVGPGVEDPEAIVAGFDPAFVTGGTSPPSNTQDVVAQFREFPMPPVVVPGTLACNDLTVSSNDTVTLSPTGGPLGNGTYCYRNLTIQGGGALTASGPVTVYMTGELIARGNSTVGVPSNPRQMVIQMSASAEATLEQGTLTGSTEFYGGLYAPDSIITISGNAEIYGSVVARQVDVTGSAYVHYDEALTDVTQVSNLYSTALSSWREVLE